MVRDWKRTLEIVAAGSSKFHVEACDKSLHVLSEMTQGLDMEQTYFAPPFVQLYGINTGRFGT